MYLKEFVDNLKIVQQYIPHRYYIIVMFSN